MPNYESVKKYIDLTIQQVGNIENINEITFIVEFPSTFRIEKPTHPSIQTSVQKGSVVTPNPPGPYLAHMLQTFHTQTIITMLSLHQMHHQIIVRLLHHPFIHLHQIHFMHLSVYPTITIFELLKNSSSNSLVIPLPITRTS
jgi:hypothetical protein